MCTTEDMVESYKFPSQSKEQLIIIIRLYPARMSNHFYRLVLNVQEELNTEDDPCIEAVDYNFQVFHP